ncbi:hypothetical protein L195_g050282, partial [Trifolium pratense]
MEKPLDEAENTTSFKLQLGGKVFYDRGGSTKYLWSTIGTWVELEKFRVIIKVLLKLKIESSDVNPK